MGTLRSVRFAVLLASVSLLLARTTVRPLAQASVIITGTTTQLTTNPGPQLDPDIAGNIVVWTDQRNGNDDVYYCNVNDCAGTEVQVTSSGPPQRLHDVSGNIIVYTDLSPPGPHIRAFDVTTNTDLGVVSPSGAQDARIDGSIVVYEVGLPGSTDVWATDLATGVATAIAATADVEENPSVSGHRIVYERHASPFDPGDIVLYDVTTGQETVYCRRSERSADPGRRRQYHRVSSDDGRRRHRHLRVQHCSRIDHPAYSPGRSAQANGIRRCGRVLRTNQYAGRRVAVPHSFRHISSGGR